MQSHSGSNGSRTTRVTETRGTLSEERKLATAEKGGTSGGQPAIKIGLQEKVGQMKDDKKQNNDNGGEKFNGGLSGGGSVEAN